MQFRGVIAGLGALALVACGPREPKPAARPGVFTLLSSAFDEGEEIPGQFTCDGDNISPPLRWLNPPEGTKSFILTMSDPDGPMGTYRHWGAYNISGTRVGVKAGDGLPNAANFQQVLNSKDQRQYLGPCPPPGAGAHNYVFKLTALDKPVLDISEDTGVGGLESAVSGSKLGEATLTGTYVRQ